MARHHLPPAVDAAFAVAAAALLAPRAASAYPWPVCGDSSSFKPNSTFQANLDLLAATLPRNASASPSLYATAVAGAVPEQVWAMALCRGDTNATSCLSCLDQAFRDLPNDCTYDKDATIYYDPCILHYSDVHTLPGDDTGPALNNYAVKNNANVTSDPARFVALLAALVNATAERAANNSARRFATGEADFDREFPKVYALAQCVPDRTAAQCRKCLAGIVAGNLPGFQSNIGGRVLGINCTYRYETAPFFNGPATVRLATPGSGAPAAAGGDPVYSAEAEDMETVDSMMIDVSTLRAATGDFDEINKLGEGGFGVVYKVLQPEGAIKHVPWNSSTDKCRVVGTYGYMAPEYLMRGNYSVKSDAFSFGVTVLEIVTGRKNSNDGDRPQQSGDLLTTVWEHWEAGTAAELVDPGMSGSFPVGDVLRCIHIGLLCVQGDPAARPVMSSVVMMLGSDTITLQAPSKPAFFARNNGTNNTTV